MSAPRSVFIHAPNDSMHLQRLVRGAAQFAREQMPPWTVRWGYLPFDNDRLKPIEFDGVIYFALSEPEKVALEGSTLPAVNVSSRNLPTRHPSVFADDEAVGRMAAKHLAEALYKHFAFAGPTNHVYAQRRYAAFCEALQPREGAIQWLDPHMILRQRRDLLEALPANTAILAANDLFARRMCALLLEAGRAVPGEIAILGVDAEEMISLSSPVSLSSIDINSYQIGYEAAHTLARLFDDLPGVPPITLIPPKGVLVAASTDHLATDDPIIAKVVELIRHQACKGLSVEELCQKVAISRRSLERRFRKAVDKSLNDQIIKVRIDRAITLLEKSDLTVGEVAERCGFASIYYFSNAFKKATGQSPRAFRTSS